MSNYLSPIGITKKYQVGRSTAYKLLKEYERQGGDVIHIGKLTRVSEEALTEYLKRRSNETKS